MGEKYRLTSDTIQNMTKEELWKRSGIEGGGTDNIDNYTYDNLLIIVLCDALNELEEAFLSVREE